MAAGISDDPPDLEDMSDYVANLRKEKTLPATSVAKRTTDATTLSQLSAFKETRPACAAKPFRKGFLNSMYENNRGQESKQQEIPFLKAEKRSKNSKMKDIPDFLKVKLEDSPRDMARKELIDMLEPTKEIVQDVMDNEIIKSGLEDPDVMAAVQEIAGNPDCIQKHRKNPKVVSFYSQLGKLMGDKIQLQERNRS